MPRVLVHIPNPHPNPNPNPNPNPSPSPSPTQAEKAVAEASTARPFEKLRAMAPTTSTSSLPSLDALGRIAGTEKATYHSTTILYASHLAPWREHPVRLLEIGVKDGACYP